MKRVTFEDLKALQATGKIKILPKPILHQSPLILQHDELQPSSTTVMYSQSTITNSKATLPQQIAQSSKTADYRGKELKQEPEVQADHQESVDVKIVWTRSATFALLSAYESRNIEADRTKKNKKFWQTIADELNASLFSSSKQITSDQVRWKVAAIKKSYNKKKDHNRGSGNDRKSFDEFEDRLSEILGDKEGTNDPACAFNSSIPGFASTSQHQNENIDESNKMDLINEHAECLTPEKTSSNDAVMKQIKASHGTGSKIAKTKLELEKQWLQHLKIVREEKAERNKFTESENKRKEEHLHLKKEKLKFKQRKLQFQDLKLTKQMEKHRERMNIEKEKCNLLKSILDRKSSFFSDIS